MTNTQTPAAPTTHLSIDLSTPALRSAARATLRDAGLRAPRSNDDLAVAWEAHVSRETSAPAPEAADLPAVIMDVHVGTQPDVSRETCVNCGSAMTAGRCATCEAWASIDREGQRVYAQCRTLGFTVEHADYIATGWAPNQATIDADWEAAIIQDWVHSGTANADFTTPPREDDGSVLTPLEAVMVGEDRHGFRTRYIPVATDDTCQHRSTVCSGCVDSWSIDYDLTGLSGAITAATADLARRIIRQARASI